VEARNLARLPGDVDVTVGAGLVMSGLTAWQGLFDDGRLAPGQTVLVHGAAGVVGSMGTRLAREAGAYVVGTGRAAGRHAGLDFGAHDFVGLESESLDDVGSVDVVFDQLSEIVQRVRDGRVRPNIGTIATLDDAVAAVNPADRVNGKAIIRVRP